MGVDALSVLRRAWRCDCDGESHEGREETGAESVLTRSMGDHVESITGVRPMSCPWRSFFDPVVKAVIGVAILADENLGLAVLDDETPALITDALPIYIHAKLATRSHDMEEDRKKREAKRKRG